MLDLSYKVLVEIQETKMKKPYIPKEGDLFIAFEKRGAFQGRKALGFPFVADKEKHYNYIEAEDAEGEPRMFHVQDWDFTDKSVI